MSLSDHRISDGTTSRVSSVTMTLPRSKRPSSASIHHGTRSSRRDDKGRLRAQALQQSTSPGLRGTVLCLAVLIPKSPREEEFFRVEVEHDPGEPLIEFSPRLTQNDVMSLVHRLSFHIGMMILPPLS